MHKGEMLEKVDAHRLSPVRVSLPASVAADLGRLKKAFGSVLEQLGCPGCCSGRDILWEIQQDFSFDKDLKAAPRALQSVSKKREGKAVQVGISPRLGGDIRSVHAALERIADLTGHPACATGCDMLFRNEVILVLDEKLGMTERVLELGQVGR